MVKFEKLIVPPRLVEPVLERSAPLIFLRLFINDSGGVLLFLTSANQRPVFRTCAFIPLVEREGAGSKYIESI